MTIRVATTSEQDEAIAGLLEALHVGKDEGLDSYAQRTPFGTVTLFVEGGRTVESFTIGAGGSIRDRQLRPVDVLTLAGDLASVA